MVERPAPDDPGCSAAGDEWPDPGNSGAPPDPGSGPLTPEQQITAALPPGWVAEPRIWPGPGQLWRLRIVGCDIGHLILRDSGRWASGVDWRSPVRQLRGYETAADAIRAVVRLLPTRPVPAH